MRILKVTRCFPPALAGGGMSQTVSHIARALVRRGHAVTVYASNLLDARRRLSDRTLVAEEEGVRIVYFHTVVRYRWDGVQPDVLRYLSELEQFDLIHVYGVRDFLSTIVCWAARRRGLPYIVEPMGMLLPVGRSLWKKRMYDRLFGRTLLTHAARVIATAAQEAEEAIAWGIPREKIVVRRNGLDLSEFDPLPPRGMFRAHLGIGEDERVVLYLGRLAVKKNVPLLIEAFAEVQLPNARLLIIGPDDGDGTRAAIERTIARMEIRNSVHVLEPLYGRERVSALVDADVLVLPSMHENFGNVVAEALVCGTPVIVTNRCGVASLVEGRTGLVIEPEKESLKSALRRMLQDEALRRQFAEQALRSREELSWEAPIEQLERLYTDVIRRKPMEPAPLEEGRDARWLSSWG
ncbi:MAG: glycosyltransferase [Acidobacteriota bacterium]|nr:glycosyltransferase [Acidobacteriota bacterium]